jgi:glycogen debranching enzyme
MDTDFEKAYAQAGNVPKLKSVYSISLYDPKNGKIHHMHRILNMEGSSPIDPQQVEKNVIAAAKRLGHDVEKLRVLHAQDLQDISGSYQVDLEKRLWSNYHNLQI